MTGLEGSSPVGPGLAAVLLVVLALGAAVGSVLRAVLLDRVAASGSARVRALGSAWANVPATAAAAALLVGQQGLDLLPGRGPVVGAVAVVALLGVCGGASTWSTLALELSRSLLAGRRGELVVQLVGAGVGVLAGLFGAGLGAVVLLFVG